MEHCESSGMYRGNEKMLLYICSPLRGNVEENIAKAREYSREAAKKGYIPIAPHCIFTQFLNDAIPEERQLGIDMGIQLLLKCDGILVCGDTITEGMAEEIKIALKQEIGVFGRDMPVEDIIDLVSENKWNESMQF